MGRDMTQWILGRGFKVATLGAAALVAIAAQAHAADMAVKAPIYKAPPVVVDQWTGGHVGVNIGYSWGDFKTHSSQPIFATDNFNASPNVDGVLGGFQAGYNWRINPQWVWGLEADITITGERKRQTWGFIGEEGSADFSPDRCCGPATLSHKWEFPWFATFRGRIGVTPTPDWLLYATGGLAVGETKYSFRFSQPDADGPTDFALSHDTTRVGYAVGVGGEFFIWRGWSAKVEYLFVDLGKVSINTRDIDGFPFHVDYRARDNILRFGLNWHFDTPVVARY
jgi:opacity protein-like surface antigen